MQKILHYLQKEKLITSILLFSFLFFWAVGLNISPFLLGPAPYPPDWRWVYMFENTLSRIWAPISASCFLLALGWFSLRKKQSSKSTAFLLSLFIAIMFLFELSVLYYSRSGIFVLIHRIINPDLNGYFTASTQITNMQTFLASYNSIVLHLPMHATGHPPGAILFFSVIRFFASLLPLPTALLLHSPSHNDVAAVWGQLSLVNRYGAVIAAFLIPMLSTTIIIPVFLLAKFLYGQKAAFFSALLYALTPSVVLFIPINDTMLGLFSVTSMLCFINGIKTRKWLSIFLSGVVFSLGLFFSTSLLPIIVMFAIIAIGSYLQVKKGIIVLLSQFIIFTAGILILPLFLLFFKFNFFQVAATLMTGLPKSRAYITWLLYNPYAFFLFAGIPTLPYLVVALQDQIRLLLKKQMKKIDSFILGFSGMITLLVISGSVRGEVERIWLPLMPFLTIIVAATIEKTFQGKTVWYLVVAGLFAVQVILFQTFLVTLW